MVPSPFTRKFMIVLATLACIGYLTYRALFTFPEQGAYALTAAWALFVAECFGILNLFLFFVQVWNVEEPPPQPVLEGRSVDVFVPTYNEDVSLLRATLEACVRMDYPHKTYVLDDGRRPEVEALARELGIHYITRTDNRHFKAGNLNNAFERTDGEFVVVLDADHVPEPHFITRLIGYFRDDRLGYVQTPHAFYNFDSFQARLDHKNRKYWEEGHLFYYVIQPGRNHWGCPIFAGSAAMFRRSAIRDVGLMATETITEDLHTGLRMNAKGWNSLAISERLVAGQAAPDITTFHAQRLRWGTGNLSIFKYDNPLWARGLTFGQRMCYLGSMLHWASGLFKLVIYLTPIAMLFSGIPPVKDFSKEFLGVIFIYLAVTLTAMKIISNGYGSIINAELFAMANFWTQIKSTLRAIVGYGSRVFHVTPKGAQAVKARQQKSVWPYIRPQTWLIILSVLALFWGWGKLLFDGNVLMAKYPVLQDVPVISSLLKHVSFGHGISDDYFKPVVPTLWVLFHFWLAYKVTQRAFWPADRRFTTRHVVHVPVEYETAAAPGLGRFGVTVDLNDTGMGFIAYERFNPGDVIRFTVRGAGEVVKCKGEVRTIADLTRGQVADGYRYGIQFLNLTAPQMDALNRVCLHYGVPRMYSEYDKGRGGMLGAIQKWQDRGMSQRRVERRNPYRLPIVVNSGVTEDTAQFSATEDISRSAVSALLDHELVKNTPVGYLMSSPLGEIRGAAKVLRAQPEQYGGKTYYRTVLEFAEFEGQGRTTVNSLINAEESAPLKQALVPDRKPITVRMAGATFVAVLIAIPLIFLQNWAFRQYHKPDRFLVDVTRQKGQNITEEQQKRLDEIYAEAIDPNNNPSSDRLVNLNDAIKSLGRKDTLGKQLEIAKRLAAKNKDDLTLQQSLIYAQDAAKEHGLAEATFNRMREHAKFNSLTPEQHSQYRLAGARIAERTNLPLSIERYDELFRIDPRYVAENEQIRDARDNRKPEQETPVYREYAGVLLKAGLNGDPSKFGKARDVLTLVVEGDAKASPPAKPIAPDDLEAKRLLVAAYLLKGRASLNDPTIQNKMAAADPDFSEAERVANTVATEAERTNNGALKEVATAMKADVFMARHQFNRAQEIIEKLGAEIGKEITPENAEQYRRLGQALVGNPNAKNYRAALDIFGQLLDKNKALLQGEARVNAVHGFLDAAANKEVALTERDKALTREVYEARETYPIDDPVYLARLGVVLQRLGGPNDLERSTAVVEQAASLTPKDHQIREQLANLLFETGNLQQASRVLAGGNEFRSREAIGTHYLREKNYTQAEEVFSDMLRKFNVGFKNPDGREVTPEMVRKIEDLRGTTLTLAAIERADGSKEAVTKAVRYYEDLIRSRPNEGDLPGHLANVYLWSTKPTMADADKKEAYANALRNYELVIKKKAWSPDPNSDVTKSKIEDGFIAAASSAPTLNADTLKIARDLAAARLKNPGGDPLSAARLAWVLKNTKDEEARKDALALLRATTAQRLTRPEEIREVARVYESLGENKAAADLLVPIARSIDDRLALARMYSGARQWDLAKAELIAVRAQAGTNAEAAKTATRSLAEVTAWAGQHAEAVALIDEIVKANPDDLEMRTFQAEVNGWAKNFDKALPQYQALIKQHPNNPKIAVGFLNAAAKSTAPLTDETLGTVLRLADQAGGPDGGDPLMLARLAEVYANKLDAPKGLQFARKAAQVGSPDPIVRREIGYVLAIKPIGLYKEADALLSGLDLQGEDRKQYVSIASQAENYEAARKQARIYLSEQLPGSLKEREARRLLADVLTWKGDYEEALAIYERLLDGAKGDQTLRVNIAEVHRFWQNYPTALQKYAELLSEQFENTQLWIGFIDAASSAPRIEREKDLLVRVHDRYAEQIQDPRRMSRLAWVMIRLNEMSKANALLNRAVAANPEQPAVRKELAGVLAAADRRSEAIEMLTQPLVLSTLDIRDMLNLADLLTAENQLDRAEKELARVVTDRSEKRYRVRYASILLWNGKYKEAQEQFARLARDFPDDREMQLRLAQSYLWARDYTTALRRYTDLVSAKVTKKDDPLAEPEIWRGFIDAAAGAAGESVRDFPRRNIGPVFSTAQRDSIFKAYNYLNQVRDRTNAENKDEMDRLAKNVGTGDPTYDKRKAALETRQVEKVKNLAGSMGRLGLLLGMLGDRERSSGAFGAALALDRNNRDVWLQYAQTLTAMGDDARAKAVFDWLIANPAQKLPAPSEVAPK